MRHDLREKYEAGNTVRQLAHKEKMSESWVHDRLREAGTKMRPGGRPKGYRHSESTRVKMSEIRRRHVANGVGGRMSPWMPEGDYSDKCRLHRITYYVKYHQREMLQDNLNPSYFIWHFYHDEQFNAVYDAWVRSGHDPLRAPSLDHIVPLSGGGTWKLQNLRYLTWWENRTKNNMPQEQWMSFRERMTELFVENIVEAERSHKMRQAAECQLRALYAGMRSSSVPEIFGVAAAVETQLFAEQGHGVEGIIALNAATRLAGHHVGKADAPVANQHSGVGDETVVEQPDEVQTRHIEEICRRLLRDQLFV